MEENIYIGIDPSLTGTGIVILNDSKILYQKLIETDSKEKNSEERLIYIIDEILKSIFPYEKNIKSIFMEGLSFGSKGISKDLLSALFWDIRTNIYKCGFQCEAVAPLELKKWAVGIANAPKNIMLKEVYKRWGKDWKADFFDDNINDAFCVAMFGRNLYLNPDQKIARDLKQEKAKEKKNKAKKNKRDKKNEKK